MGKLNIEIWAISGHYLKQNFKATEAAIIICEVESEGAVEIKTAQFCCRRFSDGDNSLKNQPRRGPSRSFDGNVQEAYPARSVKRLSGEVGYGIAMVCWYLKLIGKVNRIVRMI